MVKKIEDDSLFCSYCGAAQSSRIKSGRDVSSTPSQRKEVLKNRNWNQKDSSKRTFITYVIAGGLIILSICFTIYFVSQIINTQPDANQSKQEIQNNPQAQPSIVGVWKYDSSLPSWKEYDVLNSDGTFVTYTIAQQSDYYWIGQKVTGKYSVEGNEIIVTPDNGKQNIYTFEFQDENTMVTRFKEDPDQKSTGTRFSQDELNAILSRSK